MKKSTKFLCALVICLCSFTIISAQESDPVSEDDVPLKILGYFYSTYKHASETEWSAFDNVGEKMMRVSFVLDDKEKAATFDMDGDLIEEVDFIPGSRSEYLINTKTSQKYPDARVLTIKKVTRYDLAGDEKSRSYYEVSAKNGKDIVYVFFDEDKQLMKPDNVFNLAVN